MSMGGWYGYGFATQQAGVIHNNVVPIRELADVANHNGSASRGFALHTEEAAFNIGPGFDISPELLTLHCLRNATGVPTVLAVPDWDEFPEAARRTLGREEFFNEIGLSHGGRKNSPGVPVSVVYGPADDPRVRVNFGTIDLGGHSPGQQAALLELKGHLEARKINLVLRPGQIALIDNRRVLHGRPAYKPGRAPRYDGTDRWLRRLVVADDPGRLLPYEVASRMIDPRRLAAAARSHLAGE
jgi:L-asparagine oxygenase